MQVQALDVLNNINASNKLNAIEMKRFGIAVFDADWHQGVIGIVAARLKERFHRPTIVFAKANENELKGSARSIVGLHIRDALDLIATRYPDLINTFGGHAMAAGLSIHAGKFASFASIFDQTIKELVSEEQLDAILLSDGELKEEELSLDIAELLFRAGPWGQGFPEPIFDGVFTVNNHRIVGERHLKLSLTPTGGKRKLDAIAFNIDKYQWHEDLTQVHIAYQLGVNDFRGVRTVQLIVQLLGPADV